jgi:hypothetical protein
MTAKQTKKVSIARAAQTSKTDTKTVKPVTTAKGVSASKEGQCQVAANTLATAMKTAAAKVEEQEAELVILLDKYIVEADFLDEVAGQFYEIYPSLLDDVDYSPAEIVGELFWANLTDLGQRIALLCLKHLATEPEVPLVDLTCESCGITSFASV